MVFYAALYEDGFLWFVREEAEALIKFREEDAGSVTLVRMKGNIDIQPGPVLYDHITHEYDSITKEFLPYRNTAYCLLYKDQKIQMYTLRKPDPPLDKDFVKVLRHRAIYCHHHRQTPSPLDIIH